MTPVTYSQQQLDDFASTMTVDITTTGRASGEARRIEIWWIRVDGRFIITGTPGRRDWMANLRADPEMTVHVNGHDIAATAVELDDMALRRRIFESDEARWYRGQTPTEVLIETAPVIQVVF